MFNENLREARHQKSMSQVELAKVLGVSQSSIANWETGYRSPDIDMLGRIADALGVSLDVLTDKAQEVPRLSTEESAALGAFRLLSPADRAAVLAMMDALKKARHTTAD